MADPSIDESAGQMTKTVLLGLAALVLYWLLFANEAAILDVSARGRWYFLVPIAIAFLFSFVHGAFTGRFWDALGIKASGRKG
jgi:hypothetical protein